LDRSQTGVEFFLDGGQRYADATNALNVEKRAEADYE
jgi:hypothetical protein